MQRSRCRFAGRFGKTSVRFGSERGAGILFSPTQGFRIDGEQGQQLPSCRFEFFRFRHLHRKTEEVDRLQGLSRNALSQHHIKNGIYIMPTEGGCRKALQELTDDFCADIAEIFSGDIQMIVLRVLFSGIIPEKTGSQELFCAVLRKKKLLRQCFRSYACSLARRRLNDNSCHAKPRLLAGNALPESVRDRMKHIFTVGVLFQKQVYLQRA